MPLDVSYAKFDAISSLSVPLAEAEILVRNAHFLQCTNLGKIDFDEYGLVPFLCTFLLPGFTAAIIAHWIYLPVSFSL